MQLVREPGKLIIRSSSPDWELISFLAVLVGILVHELVRHTDPSRMGSDLVMVSGLILACLWWARPRDLVAQFQLQHREVTYVYRHGYRAQARSVSFAFTDIASLGTQERRTRLVLDYLPVITLNSRVPIAHPERRGEWS
jgi:hypothetical protein